MGNKPNLHNQGAQKELPLWGGHPIGSLHSVLQHLLWGSEVKGQSQCWPCSGVPRMFLL